MATSYPIQQTFLPVQQVQQQKPVKIPVSTKNE